MKDPPLGPSWEDITLPEQVAPRGRKVSSTQNHKPQTPNHKLEKCELMKEDMEYLGFDVGYGWWKPAASNMQPLQDMQICDDPKKSLHDVRSFVGACNFYQRHIHTFTYTPAPFTDLIKNTIPWRWTTREQEWFQELKKKIASSNCLGVLCPKGEIVLITDASDVGGG